MTTTFQISHDLAVVAEAAIAALDVAWFINLAQTAVIDQRYEMRISSLMGMSASLGRVIGARLERGEPPVDNDEINDVRRQAMEDERTSSGAPPQIQSGAAHERLYRAAFAAHRHLYARNTLATWRLHEQGTVLSESAAIVDLAGLPNPAPMTDIRLHAVVGALGYRASAVRRAIAHSLIRLDSERVYRVMPELSNIIAWTPPVA